MMQSIPQVSTVDTFRFVIYNVGTIGRSKREGRKPSVLLDAARHNLRQINAELGPGSSIDSGRTRLNQILRGPDQAEHVVNISKSKITEAGADIRKLRYDYVQAIEILISPKCDLAHETESFFQASVEWIEAWFGKDKVLSAVLHLDEPKPHLHVLISPVANGKVNGSRLINRQNLMEQKTAFQAEVASKFGLRLPQSKLSKAGKRQAAILVLTHLDTTQSQLLQDPAWPSIKTAIYRDPIAFLSDYGIHAEVAESPQAMRTSTAIFTSKGKGFQPIPPR
jgi:Plasmid recombination enzyme